MLHIDYFCATLSPYVYLSGTRLEAVASRHGATIRYKPLDVVALFGRTGGTPVGERHPSRNEYRAQELVRQAKKHDLPFNLSPNHWPTNGAPAAYAIIAAQAAGGGDVGALVHRICACVWAEQKDIADDAVIRSCLTETGFDADLADKGLMAGAETYANNLEEAVKRGVFGTPFYITETDERFWGQDRIDDLDAHLTSQGMSASKSVAGFEVGLTQMGEGDAPAMLIHCSLGRHQVLARLAGLMGKTHRVTAFDMPGHGVSADLPEDVDFQDLTTQIAAELTEPASHVLGHSFGGTVALRLAAERPDLVSRLTLCEPVCFRPVLGTAAYEAYLDRFAPYVDAMAQGDRVRAAEVFHTQWGEGAWDSLPRYVKVDLEAHIHMIAKGLPGAEGDPAGVFGPGRLEALTCPVTLVRGGTSEPIMPHVHAALAARIPNCREVVVERAGHMVPVTHPGTVAAEIL